MTALRTPDDRFIDLPGYNFEPHYVDIGGLRMHYVDEGPTDADPVLLLHGEPSWSYLYRKMIAPLAAAGHRVIAPDLIGFGRSDKLPEQDDYTYAGHVAWMQQFVETLDLRDITFFGQDWGSLIGLRVAAENESRFARIAIGNGALPTGDHGMNEAFLQWREFARTSPKFDIGRVLQNATVSELSDEVVAAYDAPFPGPDHKAGVRTFPSLVPTDPQMDGVAVSRRAMQWWREEFDGLSFMAIGIMDPVLGAPVMERVHAAIRGCPEPMRVEDAGHFVQEWGEPVARAALATWAG